MYWNHTGNLTLSEDDGIAVRDNQGVEAGYPLEDPLQIGLEIELALGSRQ